MGSREILPDLAQYVSELRQIIRTKGYGEAMKFFLGKAKEQGFPGLMWTDPFHPGFFLTVEQPPTGEVKDYVRTEDFTTGEIAVRWKDDVGVWCRKLFVSRPDNVIILSIVGPGAGKVNCTLKPELVGEKRILSELKVENGWATYHNTYQYGKGGFDVAIRVVAKGGKTGSDGTAIQVEGADEVVVLMRIAPWKIPSEKNEAWAYNPKHPDFAEGRLGVVRAGAAGCGEAPSPLTAWPTTRRCCCRR